MNNFDPHRLLDNFSQVVRLSGMQPEKLNIKLEILEPPHEAPRKLPNGKMAVYVFRYREQTLKVGKAGPKSNARYTSQHYNAGSAQSTLAASLLKHRDSPDFGSFDSENVGAWIKQNTQRINFILDAECGINVLTLLESFFQCCLNPRFEGFASQK